MDLFIIRHAWAEEPGDPAWPTDAGRPLTAEGRQRFARMVKKLIDRGLSPQVIATSPMIRCVQTAEILAAAIEDRPQIVPRDELRPGGDAEGLFTWTTKQARHHEQIAWVGHAPDVSRLAATVLGQRDDWLHFGKGSIAAVRFEAEGTPWLGHGELCWLVTAKVLGC